MNAIGALGRNVFTLLGSAGAMVLFGLSGVSHLIRPPFYGRLFLRSFIDFAYFSLPVVALTAIFSGMVIALQSYTGFSRYGATSAIANIVLISVVRELAPVLAGLMVAGRVGAAMAAELGTMRVTDQIDALRTLSTDPMKYLVAPRLLAGLLALPLLVLVADVLGVGGGFLVATAKLGFDAATLPIELSDIDLCLKLAERGWTALVDPLVHLMHEESASRGGATLRRLSVYEDQRTAFKARWRGRLREDPFFHPGLSLYDWKPALA